MIAGCFPRSSLGFVLLAGLSTRVWAGASAAGTQIPFKTTAASTDGDPVRLIASFLVCMLVLVVAIYLLRKRLGTQRFRKDGGKQVRVTESQPLGARSTLHVVEFAGTRYLLAQTEQSVQCVASAPLNDSPTETRL